MRCTRITSCMLNQSIVQIDVWVSFSYWHVIARMHGCAQIHSYRCRFWHESFLPASSYINEGWWQSVCGAKSRKRFLMFACRSWGYSCNCSKRTTLMFCVNVQWAKHGWWCANCRFSSTRQLADSLLKLRSAFVCVIFSFPKATNIFAAAYNLWSRIWGWAVKRKLKKLRGTRRKNVRHTQPVVYFCYRQKNTGAAVVLQPEAFLINVSCVWIIILWDNRIKRRKRRKRRKLVLTRNTPPWMNK